MIRVSPSSFRLLSEVFLGLPAFVSVPILELRLCASGRRVCAEFACSSCCGGSGFSVRLMQNGCGNAKCCR